MDAGIKQKWCDALRSGKYAQTTGALKKIIGSQPTYCCLGVLVDSCSLSELVDSQWQGAWGIDDGVDDGVDTINTDHIPDEIAQKVGLDEQTQHTLSSMNDGTDGHDPHSFSEIADWIDESL